MKIISVDKLKDSLDIKAINAAIKDGFKAYSEGRVTVPPVGHLSFENPPGDCHIKYGMIENDDIFVIKVASGFYKNPETYGISSSQSTVMVFNAKNGLPVCILEDAGYLTDLRTAIAGAIAAEYLSPRNVKAIGILGTGIQARLQAELLNAVTPCKIIWVWGRNADNQKIYQRDMQAKGYTVHLAATPQEVAAKCNLIVTTTPSEKALLQASDIHPGTHVTAVGADTPGKQEIDAAFFAKAHICAVDSKSQCLHHGDSSFAINAGLIDADKLIELGQIIANPKLGRSSEDQITIIDLTGVAVQDIQIAKAVMTLS